MIFFGLQETYHKHKNKKKGNVLQTRRKKHSQGIDSKLAIRRISSAASFAKASMTIEAAFSLPLFLLAVLMLISLIDMMNTYTKQQEKLYEKTRQIAVYASLGGNLTEDSCSDYISFSIPRVVHPKVKGPGYQSLILTNHCKAHIWNGYHGSPSNALPTKQEYVYVTKNGSVYHKKRSCSHLNITVLQTTAKQLQSERNEDGSKYKVCPLCARGLTKKELSAYSLYITPYGDRYHIRLQCSNLKRTIKVVPLDQVAGRGACMECGGE